MKIYNNFSLINHNSFGIEAIAEKFASISTVQELKKIKTQLLNNKVVLFHKIFANRTEDIDKNSSFCTNSTMHGVGRNVKTVATL